MNMPPRKIKDQAEELVEELKVRLEDDTPRGHERKLAAMSYVFVFCFIPLIFGDKKSKFIQFHARQGLVLFFADIIATFISWIPLFGQVLVVVLFITSIVAFLKALKGEMWEIPFIYEYSKKVNL